MVLYLCPECEMAWGEPQLDCDEQYCGQDYEDVKEKV